MNVLTQELGSLLHSNLSCAGQEVVTGRWMMWLGASIAHYGIGITIGSVILLRGYPVAWFWAFLAVITGKELAFDIPNSGFSTLVVADSVWDLLCYVIGFFVLWSLMMFKKGRPV